MKMKSFLFSFVFILLFVFLGSYGYAHAEDRSHLLTITWTDSALTNEFSCIVGDYSVPYLSFAHINPFNGYLPFAYRMTWNDHYLYFAFGCSLQVIPSGSFLPGSSYVYFENNGKDGSFSVPVFDNINSGIAYSNGLEFDDSSIVEGSVPEFVEPANQDFRPKIKTADFLYQVNLSGSVDCKLGVNFENIDVPLPTRTCTEFYLELPTLSSVQSFVDSNNVNLSDDSAVILFLNNYMAQNNNARWVNNFQYTSFVLKDELAGEANSYVLDFFDSDLRFSLLSNYPGSPNLYRIALAFAHPKSFSAYFKWKDGLAITAGGRDTYFFNQYGYNNALFRGTGGGSVASDIDITDGKVDDLTDDQFYELLLALLTQRNTDSSGNENYYYNYFNDYNTSVGDIWDKYFNGSNQDVDDAIGGIHSVLMSVRNIPLLFGTAFNHFFPKQVIDLMTFVLVLIVVLIILCIVRRFI